jgi:hypothetical protein
MYHPLFIDPSKLKDADIEAKISDLSRKYNLSAKMGNFELCDQMVLIIEELRLEMRDRQAKRASQRVNNTTLDKLVKID